MGRRIKLSGITLLILLVSAGWGWAGDVTGLKTFSAGAPAKASEVNANFTAVKTAVDDNNDQAENNYTEITDAKSRITALESARPGVAWSQRGSGGTIATTSAKLQSIILKAPTSGYAIVTASGSVYWNIQSSAKGLVRLKVSNTSGDTKEGDGVQFIQFQSGLGTGAYFFPFSTTRVLQVSKGNNTIYFNGWHQTVNGTATVDDFSLSAIFVPNNYTGLSIITDPIIRDPIIMK